MNMETLFSICNFVPMPLWLLLAFAPRWKGTQLLVHSMVIPMVLAAVYAVLMATALTSGESEGGFGSLAGLRAAFAMDEALLAGWIHYLVFDLFVGAWEVRDAQRLGINHLLVIPCLVFTLMGGPVGLLMYFCLRWALANRYIVEESPQVDVEVVTPT
jgi:hypothetical protein